MNEKKWIYKLIAMGLAFVMMFSLLTGVSITSVYAAETINLNGNELIYSVNNEKVTYTSKETLIYSNYEEAVDGIGNLLRKIFIKHEYQEITVKIPVKISSAEKNPSVVDGTFNDDVYNKTYEETGNPDEGFTLEDMMNGARGVYVAEDLHNEVPYENGVYSGIFYIEAGYQLPSVRYQEFQNKLHEVMNELTLDEKSDYEKVKAIMNYISENVSYEEYAYQENTGKPITAEKHTDYPNDMTGALLDGYAVCGGYAKLFYYMSVSAGLNALYEQGYHVSGGSYHAWNLVQIDGKYYYIDPTGTHFKNNEPVSEYLYGSDYYLKSAFQPEDNYAVENKYNNISKDDYSKEHSPCNGNHTLKYSGGMLASCENVGYTSYRCTNEGCLYVNKEYIEPLGHQWDNGTVTQEADCTHPEITTYKCQRSEDFPYCTETKTEETKAALGHNYVKEEAKATCTEDGLNTFTCSRCGDSYTETTKATGHDYDVAITEATCQKAGEKKYTCKNCGDSYTETIKKLSHNYVKTVIPATCTVGEIWNMKCSLCGNEENIDMEDPLGHDWGKEEITKQPTCTEDGVKTATCARCKETKTETIQKTGHIHTLIHNKKDASCEEEGYTGDTYCSDCNTLLEKGKVVAVTGHQWDDGVVTKEATYTEKGIKTFTCKTCKETKTEEIPVKGHEHHYDKGIVSKEATCIEDGMKKFTCSDCGDAYTESIPATGHQHTEIRNQKQTTCTENGYTGDTYCKDCNKLVSAGKVIEATGHKFDSGEVTKEATCKEDGMKTFACKNCEKTKTETIPKLTAHVWDKGKVTKEATCKETGEKLYTCSVCGETKKESIAKNTDHTWNSGKITKAGTCTENGEKTYTCDICGETKKEVVEKNRHSFGEWSNVSKATVFVPAKHKRTCSKCGTTETVSYGSKLKPTVKVNVSSLKLKKKQSTKKFVVSGLANGDFVKSWVASNKKIVTVTGKSNGTCTIKAANKTGKTKITITLASGLKKTITVTVQKSAVACTSIKNVPKTIFLMKKKSYTIKPVINPITCTQKVTYKSSNKKIATVNSKGKIVAKKKGTAKITIKAGKKKVTCKVKVK